LTRSREAASDRLAVWAALLAVGVFLVWLLARFGSVTGALYQNPDNASAFVLAEFMEERGSGELILGNYAWLEPLYALNLTRWLPAHREVWEVAPFVVYAITVALIGWTVRRAVSARAGLLVALAMAAPAPIVLGYVAVPNAHGHTLLHVAILAAFLVTLPQAATWGAGRRGLWAAALAVTLAAGASSDVLLLIGGVFPFLVAVGFGWRLLGLPGGVAALAGVACLAGTLGGRLLAVLADDAGIRDTGVPIPLASADQAVDNVWSLVEDTALFVHGQLGDTSTAIGIVLDVVGILAIAALPILCFAILRRAPEVLKAESRPPQQRLLVVYWGVAAVSVAAAFIGSSAPEGIGSTRYVTLLWPALLTLIAVFFGRRGLGALAGLAAVAAVLGCVQLARGTYTDAGGLPGDDLARLGRFAIDNDLDHGYASYANAPVVTTETDFEVRTYPVERCGPGGEGRCRYGLHRIEAWYLPGGAGRSFYLVAERPGWPVLGPPPESWGAPAEEAEFGDLHVYVYDFDLADVLE
jgi:hypothetical protein